MDHWCISYELLISSNGSNDISLCGKHSGRAPTSSPTAVNTRKTGSVVLFLSRMSISILFFELHETLKAPKIKQDLILKKHFQRRKIKIIKKDIHLYRQFVCPHAHVKCQTANLQHLLHVQHCTVHLSLPYLFSSSCTACMSVTV